MAQWGPTYSNEALRAELSRAVRDNVQVTIERLGEEAFHVSLDGRTGQGKLSWSIDLDPQDWGTDPAEFAQKVLDRAPVEFLVK